MFRCRASSSSARIRCPRQGHTVFSCFCCRRGTCSWIWDPSSRSRRPFWPESRRPFSCRSLPEPHSRSTSRTQRTCESLSASTRSRNEPADMFSGVSISAEPILIFRTGRLFSFRNTPFRPIWTRP